MSYLCCLCFFAYSGVQHVVLLYVFTFLVPCCVVFYDFRIKTMFGSSRHGPSYKQLGKRMNRTSFVCKNSNGHHNT
jgi:hypothetical protein